jgi:two-component system LytT family response regulator
MTKIRTLIADDEPVARARVFALLQEEPDVEVVGACASAAEARAAVERTAPDLLFLDIQMAEGNGLDLARALGPAGPAVVFITAYDEYALGAFEIHALDYLLKPFSAARFKASLDHAREHIVRQRSPSADSRREAAGRAPDHRQPAFASERLIVRSGGRIYFVSIADIDWCEAAGNYVRLHVGAQTHFVRETMAHLETRLDPSRFVRIHRSTIVNLARIRELHSSFNGEYVVHLRDGTRLTLSRGFREALQARLGDRL